MQNFYVALMQCQLASHYYVKIHISQHIHEKYEFILYIPTVGSCELGPHWVTRLTIYKMIYNTYNTKNINIVATAGRYTQYVRLLFKLICSIHIRSLKCNPLSSSIVSIDQKIDIEQFH